MDADVVQNMLSHASAVLVLDADGLVVESHGKRKRVENSRAALDLMVRAARTLGAERAGGEFRTMLISYEREIIGIGTSDRGSVVIVADESVQLGLLFSQIRRLQAEEEARLASVS